MATADLPLFAGELVWARNTVEAFLAGTAVIYTDTRTSDGQGGYTQAYAASGTVSARVAAATTDQFGGQELQVGGRYMEIGSRVMTVPYNTTIDTTDQVVFNSVTYEVVEVYDRTPETLGLRVRLRTVGPA